MTKRVIELHVDDDDVFQKMMNQVLLQGETSIRKNPSMKARVAFGQDESIFEPHALRSSY